MDSPEQPSEAVKRGTDAFSILTIAMPLICAAVVGFGVGWFVSVFAPHWLAIVAGVIGFLVTLGCLFASLRDGTDFIMVPLIIIILCLIIFPVFAKARAKGLRERHPLQRTVPAQSLNNATPQQALHLTRH